MKAQMNTPWILCKAMMIMAIVALVIATFLGCSAMKTEGVSSARTQLASVLQLAYDNGGRQAVSNRIEELVVEGKLSPEQATRLQALADVACEKLISDLARGGVIENTAPVESGDSSDGCTLSPPCDANADGGDGGTQANEDAASS